MPEIDHIIILRDEAPISLHDKRLIYLASSSLNKGCFGRFGRFLYLCPDKLHYINDGSKGLYSKSTLAQRGLGAL